LIKQTFYSSLWLAVASLNMTTTAVNWNIQCYRTTWELSNKVINSDMNFIGWAMLMFLHYSMIKHDLSFKCFVINHSDLSAIVFIYACAFELEPCIVLQQWTLNSISISILTYL
jgi:hypothetical protein